MKRSILLLLAIQLLAGYLWAQPSQQLIQVIVAPDHANWTYELNEQAVFNISVLRNKVPLQGVEISYNLQPEQQPVIDEGKMVLKNGTTVIKAPKWGTGGFLRCNVSVKVDGKTYTSYATAGFSPEKITPTTDLPADFKEFWENGKKELARVEMKPVLILMPERCTDKVDVYHVSINNIKGKIYGILCRPKAAGKYPAILHVPGAGIRPYAGDVAGAERGFITFQIGIHGIPVNLPQGVYDDLRAGALENYQVFNLDDKDNYYYKRVYLGCVRAIDFITSLDVYDGTTIGVTGGSQGGALSVITAGLDSRIKYLAAFYPALADLTGYLHNRAGGWPHMFKNTFTNKPEKVATSKYYDVVNFARFVTVPGWYSWGYNDNVCPPTSMHAAYNVIKAAKELYIYQETQHWTYPEQQEIKNEWLYKKLGK